MVRALAGAMTMLALLAAQASAATVSVETRGADRVLVFAAAPGERNAVSIGVAQGVVTPGGTTAPISIADSGADLVGGPGCEPTSAKGYSCGTVESAELRLGDQDDTVTIGGEGRISGVFDIRGEDGNDTVTNGEDAGRFGGSAPGDGNFDGGPGSDSLSCPVNRCTLVGGDGDDRLVGGSTLDGGDGDDTLIGLAGDDKLSGGPGDDKLYGDGERSLLSSDGADVLDGGEGADLEYGGAGGDDFRAGPRDRVEAADGKADRISCVGAPASLRGDAADVGEGCPRIHRGFSVSLSQLIFYDRGLPYLTMLCDPYAGHGCTFTADLFGPDGRRLGHFADREPAGADSEIPLRLRRRDFNAYGKRSTLRVRIVIHMRVEGVLTTGSRRIVIKYKRP